MNVRTLRILGIRGLPAAHGGFETFAEYLSLYLVQHGWRVIVYCQEEGKGAITEDVWNGVELVHIPVAQSGPLGTIVFDWISTWHASRFDDSCLTLGYNTAVFCVLLRLKGVSNLINMDGIEWSRAKWGRAAKLWFWLNDWAGCRLGSHLVADHPEIKRHLSTRVSSEKITMIPYGAELIEAAGDDQVRALGLVPGEFITLIARPEPENSILEIVRGFSARPRGVKLAVLGKYSDDHAYQCAVRQAAGIEVVFLGAIYDRAVVQALRFHSMAYVHGHQVGGTNPSLVEALGAGNAVLAHDNRFNRWVAGDGARYFSSAESVDTALTEMIAYPEVVSAMRCSSRKRFAESFTWGQVLQEYEDLLLNLSCPSGSRRERVGDTVQ